MNNTIDEKVLDYLERAEEMLGFFENVGSSIKAVTILEIAKMIQVEEHQRVGKNVNTRTQ